MVKDREAWHAAVHVVTKSQTQLSDWTTTATVWFHTQQYRECPKESEIGVVWPFLSRIFRLAVWPWENCFTSLCLGFAIRNGNIISVVWKKNKKSTVCRNAWSCVDQRWVITLSWHVMSVNDWGGWDMYMFSIVRQSFPASEDSSSLHGSTSVSASNKEPLIL